MKTISRKELLEMRLNMILKLAIDNVNSIFEFLELLHKNKGRNKLTSDEEKTFVNLRNHLIPLFIPVPQLEEDMNSKESQNSKILTMLECIYSFIQDDAGVKILQIIQRNLPNYTEFELKVFEYHLGIRNLISFTDEEIIEFKRLKLDNFDNLKKRGFQPSGLSTR